MKRISLFKELITCSTLLCIGSYYAIPIGDTYDTYEGSKYYKPRVQLIKNEEEIRRFAGKFVVYTATSDYFGKNKGFPSGKEDEYKYGYIPSKSENNLTPHILHQLIKHYEFSNTKTLNNEMMTQCSLRMRSATHQEEVDIRDAVESGKAIIEHMSTPEVMAAILESITQHKKNELLKS